MLGRGGGGAPHVTGPDKDMWLTLLAPAQPLIESMTLYGVQALWVISQKELRPCCPVGSTWLRGSSWVLARPKGNVMIVLAQACGGGSPGLKPEQSALGTEVLCP